MKEVGWPMLYIFLWSFASFMELGNGILKTLRLFLLAQFFFYKKLKIIVSSMEAIQN